MTTKAVTIAAMLGELIETHMEKCEANGWNEAVPHVISEAHGTSANVTKLITADMGACQLVHIELDDGTAFDIRVEEA